jgi:3-deoxy-7-phosphoheptulonate synthase
MIVEMQKGAEYRFVLQVLEKIKELGFKYQVNLGEERTVVAILGANTNYLDTQIFGVMDYVEEVKKISKPYKLASRDFKKEDTVVKIGDIEIGSNKVVVMAGPCSVESKEQILASAFAVKKAGGTVLRGGAFKPRTSPFAFQGLGEEGLKLLALAKKEIGLLIATEVMAPEDVSLVAEYADIIQIGTRNMQNYKLLEAVGKCGKTIILKRGMSATIEEWLCASDYILKEQNNGEGVILCERGIRTFETATRSTLDISAVPVVKRVSHLPIIIDPSHAAGDFRYVSSLAKAGIAGGADGLLIEIHPNPKKALSDGAQSLTFSDFSKLMEELKSIASAVGRNI